MNPRFEAVTIDCRDKHALAAFWCGLLGVEVRGEFGQFLGLHPHEPGHPRLVFQQVEELTEGHSRAHLDLESHDLAADTAKAVELGATVVQEVSADFGEQGGVTWTVFTDPEGNTFCLVPSGA